MLDLIIYSKEYEKKWDEFVLRSSLNGTFLQTRNFLSYHPSDRFMDNSIIFVKGDKIAAVIPANVIVEGKHKKLISHQGSTFGGIILGKQFKKLAICDEIFTLLNEYLLNEGFTEVQLKFTSPVYAKANSELLDYYAFLNGYVCTYEMGYYIEFAEYNEDILSNLSSSRRRNYRYSLKNELQFTELVTDGEVEQFYNILCDNYTKFKKKPVHTLEEILELSNTRIPENVRFYGVIHEGTMIAGAMIFLFDDVFHTQYMAFAQNETSLYPSEFLYVNLIQTAKATGTKKLSFGTATLEGGHVLNRGLAELKEAFGTIEYVNKIYTKELVQ